VVAVSIDVVLRPVVAIAEQSRPPSEARAEVDEQVGGGGVRAGSSDVRAGGGDGQTHGYGVWHVLSVKQSGAHVDRVWLANYS
jgi:hypothetical protein